MQEKNKYGIYCNFFRNPHLSHNSYHISVVGKLNILKGLEQLCADYMSIQISDNEAITFWEGKPENKFFLLRRRAVVLISAPNTWPLHSMLSFPENLEEYKNSFIILFKTKKLYYINKDQTYLEVAINNFEKFLTDIDKILNPDPYDMGAFRTLFDKKSECLPQYLGDYNAKKIEEEFTLKLSEEEILSLITSNGKFFPSENDGNNPDMDFVCKKFEALFIGHALNDLPFIVFAVNTPDNFKYGKYVHSIELLKDDTRETFCLRLTDKVKSLAPKSFSFETCKNAISETTNQTPERDREQNGQGCSIL